MFISPFLDVRLYYQSQAMPRLCVATFAILTVEHTVSYASSETRGETGAKRQRSTEFGRPFM